MDYPGNIVWGVCGQTVKQPHRSGELPSAYALLASKKGRTTCSEYDSRISIRGVTKVLTQGTHECSHVSKVNSRA
ncbi:MAG: hypothetical protein GY820_43250 [Gammaproteobacteria bacterium]|nr:hypothetical protein [Gammaproteobacteria bacterium]